jgi:arylsulfatase A-like enzyme
MIRSILLIIILFTACFLAKAQPARPNIIYIMADDMGYADLSGYGRKDYQTPNLDKLAKQGVKFTDAYAGAPVCTPTRTSFMTGRYPARTPVGLMEPLRWGHKDSLVGLTPDYTSFVTLLRNNGYETFLVGKWHLGYDLKYSPNKNGFDYFFGFNSGGIDYVSHNNPKRHPDLYENETSIQKDGYLTDVWADKAVEIIKQKHAKPFYMSVMFNAPHWPWQAPGDPAYPDSVNWHKGGTPAKYAGMIKSLDSAVGRIMKALDDAQLSSNTLLIFTSDNGGEEFSDMGVFSGKKETLYEGGIREPAFVRWPGVIPPNSVTKQPAITMDWTATILAAAKTKADPAFPLDGANLLPVCSGKQKAFERTFYWRLSQEFKQKAIRDGKWKYLQTEKGEFLFNLQQDPAEKNDLKEKLPALFTKLKNKYSEWEKEVLPPVSL